MKSVSKDITKARAQGAHGTTVSGYFNQEIVSNDVQAFMRQNRLFEVHRKVNNIEGDERDDAYKKGRNQIDVVFATDEVLSAIRGRKKCISEKC